MLKKLATSANIEKKIFQKTLDIHGFSMDIHGFYRILGFMDFYDGYPYISIFSAGFC